MQDTSQIELQRSSNQTSSNLDHLARRIKFRFLFRPIPPACIMTLSLQLLFRLTRQTKRTLLKGRRLLLNYKCKLHAIARKFFDSSIHEGDSISVWVYSSPIMTT